MGFVDWLRTSTPWIPAFAGMTAVLFRHRQILRHPGMTAVLFRRQQIIRHPKRIRHSGAAQPNPESMGFVDWLRTSTPWIPAFAGMTAVWFRHRQILRHPGMTVVWFQAGCPRHD